ncbi:MAG: GNAT family N-acetyltransferase [Promethearchaeota archaeon]
MDILNISPDELDYVEAVCLDPSIRPKWRQEMKPFMQERKSWLQRMMQKELQIIVALEEPEIAINALGSKKAKHRKMIIRGKFPLGLIEYLPIQYVLEPVIGEYSLFINCIWILPPFWRKGVAKTLVNKAIEDAQRYGGISVLAYEGDKWFGWFPMMPSEFFKKFGFIELDRDGSRLLLHLDLGGGETPTLIHPKTRTIDTTTQMKIEALHNCQCPWSGWMIQRLLHKMKKSNINVELINTDDRKVIAEYGLSRGICINGIPIIKRLASWKEIQSTIKAMKRKNELVKNMS